MGSFSDILDIRVVPFFKQFLEGAPERLQDQFGFQRFAKSLVFVRAWMLLEHGEYWTDLILACFLPDALPRPASVLNFTF